VRMFLDGRHRDLIAELRGEMQRASEGMLFEQAAVLRDVIATVEEMEQRQKMAAAQGDDIDIFGFYASRRWWRKCLPPAEWPHCGPARVLLGDQLVFDPADFSPSC